MNRVRYLSLAALLLIAPAGPVLADSTEPLEQLVVEMAETSEQHLALANYYHQKAKISQEEAGRHRSMAAAYVAGKFRSRQLMRTHCEEIVANEESSARAYEALAVLHEQEARGEQ